MHNTLRRALSVALVFLVLHSSCLFAHRFHSQPAASGRSLHGVRRTRLNDTGLKVTASLFGASTSPRPSADHPYLTIDISSERVGIVDDCSDGDPTALKEMIVVSQTTPPARARRRNMSSSSRTSQLSDTVYPSASTPHQSTCLVRWCKSNEPIRTTVLLI